MVKNSHNNKINNYINIVNDLKGLGLLQKRRKSNRVGTQQKSKIQAKPQGISGIEKTIIDNSPQLRRDVQQLAVERSLLDGRMLENEDKINFLRNQIVENPGRFIKQEPSYRSLSNVGSNSLRLPSLESDYESYINQQNDSIDTPIFDASSQFKRPGDDSSYNISFGHDYDAISSNYTSDSAHKSQSSVDELSSISDNNNYDSSIQSNNTPLSYKEIYGNISQIKPEINPMTSEPITTSEVRSEQKSAQQYNPYQDRFNRMSPSRKINFKSPILNSSDDEKLLPPLVDIPSPLPIMPSPLDQKLSGNQFGDMRKAFQDLKTNTNKQQFLDFAKQYGNQKSNVIIDDDPPLPVYQLGDNKITTSPSRKAIFDLASMGPSSKKKTKKENVDSPKPPVKMHGTITREEDNQLQRTKRESVYLQYQNIAEQFGVVVKPRSRLNTLAKIKAELDNLKTMKDVIS